MAATMPAAACAPRLLRAAAGQGGQVLHLHPLPHHPDHPDPGHGLGACLKLGQPRRLTWADQAAASIIYTTLSETRREALSSRGRG